MDYDYVVVGGGSAGCVLANRLSADPTCQVLLLEAGPRDIHPLIHIPLGMGKIHEWSLLDWGFRSEPEPALHGRRLAATRGKVLGGSSSVNVMAFTRGHPTDYDRWALSGVKGWSYAECLPYFKRSEHWEGGADEFRGAGGPIGVEFARTQDPLFAAWMQAARESGYPITSDYNGVGAEGFGRSQYSIRSGWRSSTSNAYLRPARKRKNLHILTGALAQQILTKGSRATGVSFIQGRRARTACARREVLVCAGTFQSPQLLMLSGVGPSEELRQLNIEPTVDLPAVGRNLQEHLVVTIFYDRPHNPSPFRSSMRADKMAAGMVQAYFAGSGVGTVLPGGLHAFVKTRPENPSPDIEFMFRGVPQDAYLWFPGIRSAYKDGYGIRAALLHPESRGIITLRSSNAADAPVIRYNCLASSADLETLRDGFKRARSLGERAALNAYRGAETVPGPDTASDEQIDDYIRKSAVTCFHPAGTCAMGIDTTQSVVSERLFVHGFDNLRVVDASVMPTIVGAHLNAAVIMMAEKISDDIIAT